MKSHKNQEISSKREVLSKDPPRILRPPTSQTSVETKNVTLMCYLEGKPKSTVTWYRNGILITQDDRISVTQPNSVSNTSTTVTITNVNRDDEGRFYCQAVNDVNTSTSSPALFTVNCSMSSWPKGVYGLLKPSTGCPSTEWDSKGFLFQDTVDVNPSNNRSEILHVDGHVDPSYVMRLFCLKRSSTGSETWPKGQYCIYKRENGTLPGMHWGWMRMRDEYSDNRDVAELTSNPILSIKKDNRIIDFYFYCNTKGNKKIPVELPITKPFYLLPYGSSECQQVKWMVATTEWIKYHTRDYQGYHQKDGTVPYYELGDSENKGITMYYCYYESCNYTFTKKRGIFQSPGFPQKYPDGQLCSWRIMVPANHTLHVHFTNFSLYGNDEEDNLTFSKHISGGFKLNTTYHGNREPFTITATSNVLFELITNEEHNSTGFRAVYTIFETCVTTSSTTTFVNATSTPLSKRETSTTTKSTLRTTLKYLTSRYVDAFKESLGNGQDATKMIVVIVIAAVCFLISVLLLIVIYRYRVRGTESTARNSKQTEDHTVMNPIYDREAILLNQPTDTRTADATTTNTNSKKLCSADKDDANPVYHVLEGPDPNIGPPEERTYDDVDEEEKCTPNPLYTENLQNINQKKFECKFDSADENGLYPLYHVLEGPEDRTYEDVDEEDA